MWKNQQKFEWKLLEATNFWKNRKKLWNLLIIFIYNYNLLTTFINIYWKSLKIRERLSIFQVKVIIGEKIWIKNWVKTKKMKYKNQQNCEKLA